MSRTSSGAWGHEIRKRCSARVRQDASFFCGHAAIWSGTFKRSPEIALKWTWWLLAGPRAWDLMVLGIYSEASR